MLHLLAFSDGDQDLLEQLSATVASGDVVILLNEGLTFIEGKSFEYLKQILPINVQLYQLQESRSNLKARPAVNAQMPVINHDRLVLLTEEHNLCCSWYPHEKCQS